MTMISRLNYTTARPQLNSNATAKIGRAVGVLTVLLLLALAQVAVSGHLDPEHNLDEQAFASP